MNKRQEQKEMRRQQIIEAGLDLFIKNGYHGTTTKEIADSIGISQGLMFHYFDSKESLYLELLLWAQNGSSMVFEQPLTEDISPLLYMEIATKTILRSFADISLVPKLFILVTQTQIANNLPKSIQEAAQTLAAMEYFRDIIIAGQSKGDFKAGDPDALAGCYFGAILGIAQTYVSFANIPLPEPQWLLDMLIKHS